VIPLFQVSLAYPPLTICRASHPAWPSISLTLRPLSSYLPPAKQGVFSRAIGFAVLPRLSVLCHLTCIDSSPRNTMACDGGATVPARCSRFPKLAYLLMARRADTGFSRAAVRAPPLPPTSIPMNPLCSPGGLRREERLVPHSPTPHLRERPLPKCALLRLAERHVIPDRSTEIR